MVIIFLQEYLMMKKNIITGSENKDIFIYDIDSGEVVNKIRCPSPNHVVHIVEATTSSSQIKIVSSSIEEINILRWTPNDNDTTNTINEEDMDKEEEFYCAQRAIIESLMNKYGDKILELFHKYNVTFSSPVDWNSIMQSNETDGLSDGLSVVEEISEDFTRAIENGEPIFSNNEQNIPQIDEDGIGETIIGKLTHSFEYYVNNKN